MEYSFNIEYAEKYGVAEAIVIKNFQYWIKKNKSNSKANHDGRTWTFNSVKAFEDLFPFWTVGQMNRILKSLVEQEVLLTGNYNKMKYDRTKWYAFSDEYSFVVLGSSISRKQKMDLSEPINGFTETDKPIPNVKEDIKQKYYKDMIVVYDNFCKHQFDAPAMINGQEGKAMKSIMKYLKNLCKVKGDDSPEQIIASFEYILANWEKLEPFLQKQIKLSQINSNITNIINQLKNGGEKRSSNNLAEQILDKYR
tara:strand:+ start:2456 stop:3214 length:759 start_codon:yes stop_codon:yes gene_type:complete